MLVLSSRPGALTHASVPHPACGVPELQWMKVANSFKLNLTLQSLDPWDTDPFACAEVRSHEVHISKPPPDSPRAFNASTKRIHLQRGVQKLASWLPSSSAPRCWAKGRLGSPGFIRVRMFLFLAGSECLGFTGLTRFSVRELLGFPFYIQGFDFYPSV